MKTIRIGLLLFFVCASIAGAWTFNEMINDAEPPANQRGPDIFIDEDGVIHIVWADYRDHEHVYYARSEDGGATFGSNIRVTNRPGVRAERQQGPVVYARDGHIYVTYNNTGRDVNAYIVHSEDEGQTWSDRVQVNRDEPENQFFHDLVVDSEGRVFVTWMEFPRGYRNPGYMIARSEDNAESFDNYVMVNDGAPGEVCDCCAPDLTIDEQDRIFVAWRNNDENIRDIYMSRSTDNGDTFDQPVLIYENNWRLNACPSTGPSIRVADDRVYATWISGVDDVWRVWFNISEDSGETFGDANILSHHEDADVRQNFPEIALGNDGDIWIVWQDNRSGNNDILASLSRDYGETFPFLYTVNNDDGNSIQESPMGATGPNGEYAIVWLDRRHRGDDIFFTAEQFREPIWTEPPFDSYDIEAGNEIEFAFAADGAVADSLTFTLVRSDLPESAELEDNGDRTGSFSWTTRPDDVGFYEFAIVLSNGDVSDSLWVSIDVTESVTVKDDQLMAESCHILSTYPNPFNSKLNIEYSLPTSGLVCISVYNLKGDKVAELYKGYKPSGIDKIDWSAEYYTTGVYFICFNTIQSNSIKKVLLMN